MDQQSNPQIEYNRISYLKHIHQLESDSKWEEASKMWLKCPKNGLLDAEYDKRQSEACAMIFSSSQKGDAYRAEISQYLDRIEKIKNELKEGTGSFEKAFELTKDALDLTVKIKEVYQKHFVAPVA